MSTQTTLTLEAHCLPQMSLAAGSESDIPSEPTELVVGGINLTVWGLAKARKAHSVACLFLLHGRQGSAEGVKWIAESLAKLNDEKATPPTRRALVVVTLDHRNHGRRIASGIANEGWRPSTKRSSDGSFLNLNHFADMYAIQTGTQYDVSHLVDHLPAFLFPYASKSPIDAWICVGISLGGHTTWLVGAHDPRFRYLCPIIGSPDVERLLRSRATTFDPPIPFDAPVVPELLLQLVRRNDPCHAPLEAWKGKKILVLGGAVDKLVPHVQGGTQDFVKGLETAEGVEVWIQDDVGHACTEEMVSRLSNWLETEVLET